MPRLSANMDLLSVAAKHLAGLRLNPPGPLDLTRNTIWNKEVVQGVCFLLTQIQFFREGKSKLPSSRHRPVCKVCTLSKDKFQSTRASAVSSPNSPAVPSASRSSLLQAAHQRSAGHAVQERAQHERSEFKRAVAALVGKVMQTRNKSPSPRHICR